MIARSAIARSAIARRGSSAGIILVILSLVILAIAVFLLRGPSTNAAGAKSLRLYCAAGIKPAIEDAIQEFQSETGVSIEVQYGGSGTLLSQLQVKSQGVDLYLAADSSYLETAREKKLVRETIPLSTLTPVIAVKEGNPLGINGVDDLLGPPVKFGLANPDAAAVGKAARKVLTKLGKWEEIAEKCKVFKPTVNEIANDVAIGSIDAAIIWDATARQMPKIEAVEMSEFDQSRKHVTIGVTEASENPTTALQFARFLNADDRGQPIFEKHGFATIDGDQWALKPKLVLFAGSMFNQAVEETVREFEAREGVEVSCVYNGCGILVGQMRAGAMPDAYLSCDASFMDEVGDEFGEAIDLTENRLVLITDEANAKGIEKVQDLSKQGLRVGLAHPKKSALGHITEQLLTELDVLNALTETDNWKQDAPQGDFLINSLRTGALDAAIVYQSNAEPFKEKGLRIVAIDHSLAIARQPYAVANQSQFPHTMDRLLDSILAADSQHRFERLGFRWIANESMSLIQP